MKFSCFLLFFYCSISLAQFDKETQKPNLPSFNPLTLEAVSYLTNDTSSIEIFVLYNINPKFLVFSKTNTSQKEIFIAKADLIIEILDDKSNTVARDFKPIQIKRDFRPDENSILTEELRGAFNFKLNKDKYKIIAEIKDYESDKSFINKDEKINSQNTSTTDINISSIIFIEPLNQNSNISDRTTFFPVNNGDNAIIGEKYDCLFQVVLKDTSTALELTWRITNRESEEDDADTLSGNQYFQLTGLPVINNTAKKITLTVDNNSFRSRILVVPIHIERLINGNYQLAIKIVQGKNHSQKELPFKILWPSEPKSLSNSRIKLEALSYIATKEELKQMSVFSYSKSKKAFHEFWKKRNPDTTRAYNPAMAEYYRRVDETIKKFSNDNEQDGYLTDRGRIYILFGSPTLTNRLLKPNTTPKEIWTYEKLRRRFTFSDERRNGNYTLIKTENY